MKRVRIFRVDDYEPVALTEKLREAITGFFPLEKYFSPGDKILLKPNLLMASPPDEVIVTNPEFVRAIGKIFKEKGYPVFIGDSPGGFITTKEMDNIYETCGLKAIAGEEGFELLYPSESVIRDDIPFCQWVDGYKIVNVPKLKTHGITVLTMAVKNLYGCISGLYKSHLHKVHTRTDEFVGVLLKLYGMIRPSLNIIDGIRAMEGEGPAKKGSPVKLGIVAIGDDALYTDYAVSGILGLDEHADPLVRQAKKKGLINNDDLGLISDLKRGEIRHFKFPSPFILNCFPESVLSLVKLFFKFRPKINVKKCVGCAACKKICPNGAVSLQEGKAVINYDRCILCMCCEEVCPYAAVYLDKSFLLKVADKLH